MDVDCLFSFCGTQDNAAQGCMPGAYQDITGHTWACQGNARDINCHVGLCDYAGPGQCVSPSTPYGTGYEWTCEGANSSESADDVDCVKAQCNDAGADNTIEGCTTGIWEHVDGPNWHCRGSAIDPPPPASRIEIDDDLGCTPTFPDGQCGYDDIGDCEQGRKLGTGNPWVCQGPDSNADTDDKDCFIGVCDYEDDTTDLTDGCQVGTYDPVVPGARWHCRGSDNGRTDDDETNCLPPRYESGECKYDNVGECEKGDSSDPSGNTNPWMCAGNHPDPDFTADDAPCEIGICGTTDDPTPGVGCLAGTHNDVPGDTWECLGNHPVASITTDDARGCMGCTGEPTANYTAIRTTHSRWDIEVTATDPDSDPLQYRFRSSGQCIYSQPSLNNDTGWIISNTNRLIVGGIGGGGGGPVEIDCGINIEVTDGLCTVTADRIATAICGATDYTCDVGNVYSQQPGPPPTWICDLDDPFGGVPGVPCTGSVDAVCGTADNAVQGCTDGTLAG